MGCGAAATHRAGQFTIRVAEKVKSIATLPDLFFCPLHSGSVWFDDDGCTILLGQQPYYGDVVNLDMTSSQAGLGPVGRKPEASGAIGSET